MKKAIIIGATSGIGKALAKILSERLKQIRTFRQRIAWLDKRLSQKYF